MDVLNVFFEVFLISNVVFPKSALPYSAFATFYLQLAGVVVHIKIQHENILRNIS